MYSHYSVSNIENRRKSKDDGMKSRKSSSQKAPILDEVRRNSQCYQLCSLSLCTHFVEREDHSSKLFFKMPFVYWIIKEAKLATLQTAAFNKGKRGLGRRHSSITTSKGLCLPKDCIWFGYKCLLYNNNDVLSQHFEAGGWSTSKSASKCSSKSSLNVYVSVANLQTTHSSVL